MGVDRNKITKEMIDKAKECRDAGELMELAKTYGYELTKEEADSYMMELQDLELDEEQLAGVAGGLCYTYDLPGELSCTVQMPR